MAGPNGPRRRLVLAGALGLLGLFAWLALRDGPRSSAHALSTPRSRARGAEEPAPAGPAAMSPPLPAEAAAPTARREIGEAPPGTAEVVQAPAETLAVVTVCVERDGVPLPEVEVCDGRPTAAAGVEHDPLVALQGLGYAHSSPRGSSEVSAWASGLGMLFVSDPGSRNTVWTDPDGCAVLSSLEPGERAFWLRPPGSAWVRLLAELAPGPNRLQVALGTATISGHAWASDGAPDAGAPLTLFLRRPPEGAPLWRQTATDLDGAYAFTDLAGGDARAYRITPPPLLNAQTVPFTLARGERRVLDFGSPHGSARLSATVRLASGRELELPQHLFVQNGPCVRLGTLTRTGFTMDLPLGSYVIRLGAMDGPVAGEVELEGDLHRDLVVPGITVCGAVEYVGTKHPFARGPETEVVLELLDALGRPTGARGLRGERGYSFLGLSPGSYALATSPWPIEGTDGHLPIVVEAGVTEVVVDLRITDP